MVKKIAYGALALLALISAAAAFYLVPPHQQIRQFNSAIPTIDQLSRVLESAAGPIAISYVTTASQKSPTGTLGHVGVLIEWANGKTFLIDSGMNESDAVAFGKAMETVLGAQGTLTFGPIEEQLGNEINRIAGIGFTHLHSDHTVGITDICKAQNLAAEIFQTPDQAANHNGFTEAGQQLINTSACNTNILDQQIIKTIPGFAGLVAIAAGGHTPGSTIYAAKLKGKIWLFAGDITNVMDNLVHNKGKGFMYSYLLIPEDTDRLEQLRVWLGNINKSANASVLVAHDLLAWQNSELPPWAPTSDVAAQ